MATRVMVVDDQAMIRAGFKRLLTGEDDIEVVAEAADGREAIELCALHKIDVVLMDIRMPNLDGIEATRLIRTGPDAPFVLVLTTFDLDELVFDAIQAGASGFLLKDSPPEQLALGVRTVADGEALLAPSITRRLIGEFARRPARNEAADDLIASLSARELETYKLIAQGLSNAEIADALTVSETTVKSHVSAVLSKLELRDRVQAVVMAYETGLIQPGSGS
jgi:DNA-binding NarL/FixJ family response regulator